MFHDPNKRSFWWYPEILGKLERNIRRKWVKDLPNVNIILEKIKRSDDSVKPINLFQTKDSKQYFELSIRIKDVLETNHERRHFKPRRHRKILGKGHEPIRC